MEETDSLLPSQSQENGQIVVPAQSHGERSWKLKLGKIISTLTIEPCLFLYLVAVSLQSILYTDFVIVKACTVHYNYSSEICGNLSSYSDEESKVQQYANQIILYASLIEKLPCVLFVLFIGAWSDKHGRKLAILMPFVGGALNAMLLMVNVFLWYLPPSYILLASIPKGITGGLPCLMTMCYAYITDLSSLEYRTIRIALIDYCFALGPLAAFLSESLLYKKLKFAGLFGLSASVTVICILYIIFGVVETKGRYKGTRFWCYEKSTGVQNELVESNNYICGHIIHAVLATFKKRQMNIRCQLLLCIASLALINSTYDIGSIEFLFTNERLKWTYADYLHFITYQSAFLCIGGPFLVALLTVKLAIPDLLISMIGGFLKMVANGIEAFVTKGWMLYMVNVIGFSGFLAAVGTRSVISKLVSKEEIGKIFSFVSCLEILLPLFSNYIFILIYDATMDIFAGIFLLVCSFIVLISILLLVIVVLLIKKSRRI